MISVIRRDRFSTYAVLSGDSYSYHVASACFSIAACKRQLASRLLTSYLKLLTQDL